MVRIWKVEYGDIDRVNVEAPNVREAIRKARSIRNGAYMNRIQDISTVELLAET